MLSRIILVVIVFLTHQAFAQPGIYFLPSDYDGSRALDNIATVSDVRPICGASPPLEGLDQVRGFAGANTCSSTSVSERLSTIPAFILLVDDTRQLSPYLVNMLRVQNALTTHNGREIVDTKVIELTLNTDSSSALRILVVGEQAYRNLAAERWYAVVNSAPTTNPIAAGPSGGGIVNRVSWQTFKSTPQLAQFTSAVRTMRANTDANDDDSWLYWSNIHRSNCPHSAAYFLAWHRGYLYHFEKKIQEISGNSNFRLPYWDYYADANMPREFTNSGSSNPLYVAGRSNTNVRAALSLHSFEDIYVNFPRGQRDAFEPEIESLPHNQVHNIIGRPWMLSLNSPRDPIFWVHHANIDRLWSAWVAAGNGRNMPAKTANYWSGSLPDRRAYSGVNFKYGSTLTLERNKTYETRQDLQYDYDNKTLPTTRPPAAPSRPSTRPRGASLSGDSGTTAFALNESSVTIPVTVPTNIISTFNSVRGSSEGLEQMQMSVVLSGVQLTDRGRQGGFAYSIYLNLPTGQSSGNSVKDHFIGTVGPFEIDGLAHEHHGDEMPAGVRAGDLVLDVPVRVLEQAISDPAEIEASFVRVNGENFPRGEVIQIQGIRIIMQNEQQPGFPNS